MKKNIHPRPTEYRIRYRVKGSVNDSVQHYMVYHSSEALDFLFHTLSEGHIHGGVLRILAVEEFNRFSDKWDDRTSKASEHSNAPLVSEGNSLWLQKEQSV